MVHDTKPTAETKEEILARLTSPVNPEPLNPDEMTLDQARELVADTAGLTFYGAEGERIERAKRMVREADAIAVEEAQSMAKRKNAWFNAPAPQAPELLVTREGKANIRKGRLTVIHGEYGSAKTWLGVMLAAEWLGDAYDRDKDYRHVFYLNYENPPADLAQRFRYFGMTDDVLFEDMDYAESLSDIDWLCDPDQGTDSALVIVDSFDGLLRDTGATGQGAGNDSIAVQGAYGPLQEMVKNGSTVVVLDHTNRAGEFQGSQRKLSGVDDALSLGKTVEFNRDTDGFSTITQVKNRSGYSTDPAYLACTDGEIYLTSRKPTRAKSKPEETALGQMARKLERDPDAPDSELWRAVDSKIRDQVSKVDLLREVRESA